MPNYSVPVVITINGTIDVECDTPEQAIELAKAEYDRRWKENMKGKSSFGALACEVMDCPDVEVDFAGGDDPEDVIDNDNDEEEDEG